MIFRDALHIVKRSGEYKKSTYNMKNLSKVMEELI